VETLPEEVETLPEEVEQEPLQAWTYASKPANCLVY
jgi:hypothetical protein